MKIFIRPAGTFATPLRRWLASASLLVAALSLAAVSPAAASPQGGPAGVGHAAPEFQLPSLDGQTVSLAALRGRPVVIHFAATWCPFCNAELPNLIALDRAYKARGVQVLIVDINESRSKVERWARKHGVTFPVLLDADGAVAKRYAPPKTVQPDLGRDEVMVAANLLIDRQGQVRFFSLLDSASFDARLVALRARLDELLAGP
jgi:peroxiredoxin